MESTALEQAAKVMGTDGVLRDLYYRTGSPETFLRMMELPANMWREILSSTTEGVTLESIAIVQKKVAARLKKRGRTN